MLHKTIPEAYLVDVAVPDRTHPLLQHHWEASEVHRREKKGLYMDINVKIKFSRYRPGVAQRVGRVIALLFHDRSTRRGWVFSSTPRPHFTPGKDPVQILQQAGCAPGPVWKGGKSRPHRDSNPDRPAGSQLLYRLSYRTHLYKDTATEDRLYNTVRTTHSLCRYSDWLRAARSGIEYRWGRDFPPVQTGPGAHPASCTRGTGSFPGIKCGRSVLLTTHPLLVLRSWKSRAILLPTLWATPGL